MVSTDLCKIQLIPEVLNSWISYQGQTINVYAQEVKLKDLKLQLNFPYNPAVCEELNCIVRGIDYKIEKDKLLKICFDTKVRRSPFRINNYTRLPYRIDRSAEARPILVYIKGEDRDIEIVEDDSPLRANQVRWVSDEEVECSSDLIGKTISISCSVLILRWINNLKKKIQEPITCYLNSDRELQVLEGKIEPSEEFDLHLPHRTIILKNIRQIKREKL